MERLPNVDKLQEVIMSRTYRRKKDKAPDWVTRDWSYKDFVLVKRPLTSKELKREVSKWHSDAGYHGDYGDSPSWFVHEFMEVPFRAKSKMQLKEVLRLVDYEDADVTTIFKKPQEYYW